MQAPSADEVVLATGRDLRATNRLASATDDGSDAQRRRRRSAASAAAILALETPFPKKRVRYQRASGPSLRSAQSPSLASPHIVTNASRIAPIPDTR